MRCERCGETGNVRVVCHELNVGDTERLCWDCREPIIRARGETSEPEPSDEPDETDAPSDMNDPLQW